MNKFEYISTRWPWFVAGQGRAEELACRVLSRFCMDIEFLQQRSRCNFFISSCPVAGFAHADCTAWFQGNV